MRRVRARCGAISIAFLSLLLSSGPAWTEEVPGPLSVYEVKPVRDGVILGATALLNLYPALNDFNIVYIRPSANAEDLNPWDRKAIGNRNVFQDTLSDITVAASMALPVLVDYLDVGWSHVFFEDMMVYAQVLSINSALTSLFKYTVQRPIPRVYAGDLEVSNDPSGYREFYSGHVSTTTAALSAFAFTLDLRHHSGVWPWLVAGVVGTTVAFERVAAGEHFPTGVLVGAIMGPTVGFLVPWLHRREIEGVPTITLKPVSDGGQVVLMKRF